MPAETLSKGRPSPRFRIGRRRFLATAAAAPAAIGAGAALASPARALTGPVVLVHTQAAGDKGPIDSMIGRLEQLAAARGFQARTVHAGDPARHAAVLNALGAAGAPVVFGTFPVISQAFRAAAAAWPKTRWIHLFGRPATPPIPGLVTVSYDYYLGCYLSGVFAAHVSRSKRIGYIGGIGMPPLYADLNALKAGVRAADPGIAVRAAFAGSFQDPAKGHEIARRMFDAGIDYIQADSAATDAGIIRAANEQAGRMVCAVDPAQFALGPGSVIAVAKLDFGQSLHNKLSEALDPGWRGGRHVRTGLGTGVIDFRRSPLYRGQAPREAVARSDRAWPHVERARAAILDGTLKVPFDTVLRSPG